VAENVTLVSAVISDMRRLQRQLQSLEDEVAHLIAVVDAHAELLQSIGVLASELGVSFDATNVPTSGTVPE
jgi:hypothetical protein